MKEMSLPYIYLLTPWSRFLLEKLTVNFAASQDLDLDLDFLFKSPVTT
jgi:hypothetical protein